MLATRFAPRYDNGNSLYGSRSGWRTQPEVERRGGRSFEKRPSRMRPERRSRSRGPVESDDDLKPSTEKSNKSLKWLGLALAFTSSASISLGISNIAVTASTVFTSDTQSGCFVDSQWYQQLGPKNSTMRSLDWSWITVGLWSALLTYLAGLAVGKIKKSSSSLRKFMMVAAVVSLIAFLPARLILAVLDSMLSSGCQETNLVKFALPISVAVVAVVEFVLLVVILLRFRKQVKAWKASTRAGVDGSIGADGVTKVNADRFNASRPSHGFYGYNLHGHAHAHGHGHRFHRQGSNFHNQAAMHRLPAPSNHPFMQPSRRMAPICMPGVITRWTPRSHQHFMPSIYRLS